MTRIMHILRNSIKTAGRRFKIRNKLERVEPAKRRLREDHPSRARIQEMHPGPSSPPPHFPGMINKVKSNGSDSGNKGKIRDGKQPPSGGGGGRGEENPTGAFEETILAALEDSVGEGRGPKSYDLDRVHEQTKVIHPGFNERSRVRKTGA